MSNRSRRIHPSRLGAAPTPQPSALVACCEHCGVTWIVSPGIPGSSRPVGWNGPENGESPPRQKGGLSAIRSVSETEGRSNVDAN